MMLHKGGSRAPPSNPGHSHSTGQCISKRIAYDDLKSEFKALPEPEQGSHKFMDESLSLRLSLAGCGTGHVT